MAIIIDSTIPDFCMARTGQLRVVAQYHLPAVFGTGQISRITTEPGLTMVLRHLLLAEDLIVKRQADSHQADMLLLSIQAKPLAPTGTGWHLATILLTPAEAAFTLHLPAHTNLFMVSLVVHKSLLTQWFAPLAGGVAELLAAQMPVIHDTLLLPDLQRVLLELASSSATAPWQNFFYRLKAQELVYFMFQQLAQPFEAPLLSRHPDEMSAVSRVRDYLLASLATPPSLPHLAKLAGLNEAKLRKLFRLVFGTSIYQYYQAARMDEARQRLAQFSVSEVGFQLGFVNLSHFTRLFTKHYGFRPKHYQTRLHYAGKVTG